VLKICSSSVRGCAQTVTNLDRPEQFVGGVLDTAQEHEIGEVYGRFMGGSDRNTSNPGRFGQSAQFMQFVQSLINTGDFASC
jgi:hypothetical protein